MVYKINYLYLQRSSNTKHSLLYNLKNRKRMKAIEKKWFMVIVASICTLVVTAQNDLTVKVTNIPSDKGKVMIATDKGQRNMTDAKSPEVTLELKAVPEGKCKLYVFHDENGNYQLDMVDGKPSEYCATVDLEVTADTKSLTVTLINVLQEIQKEKQTEIQEK